MPRARRTPSSRGRPPARTEAEGRAGPVSDDRPGGRARLVVVGGLKT